MDLWRAGGWAAPRRISGVESAVAETETDGEREAAGEEDSREDLEVKELARGRIVQRRSCRSGEERECACNEHQMTLRQVMSISWLLKHPRASIVRKAVKYVVLRAFVADSRSAFRCQVGALLLRE